MGVVRSSFFRLFAGGFAAGVAMMIAMQPVEANRAFGGSVPVAGQR